MTRFAATRARKGFTLAEILIAIAIGAIILLAAVSFLFTFILNLEQTDEHTAATQRAEMVMTILANPVLQSGTGIPSEASDFQESLAGLTTVSGWDGPVSAVTTSNPNDTVRIVYSVNTDSGLIGFSENTVSDGNTADLTFDGTSGSGSFSTDNGDPRGWCVLPATGVPLKIMDINGAIFTVTTAASSTKTAAFVRNDSLCSLRAMEARVTGGTNPVFQTVDVGSGSGYQPRVQGISGIHFDLDSDAGILTVTVLARGNKRHDDAVTPSAPEGWNSAWGFSSEDTHYRFSVLRTSWRLRN